MRPRPVATRVPVTGSAMVKTAPVPVGAIGRRDRAAHGFDEAAADGEAEAGSGSHAVALPHAVELLEDVFEVAQRDPLPFIEHLDAHRAVALGTQP